MLYDNSPLLKKVIATGDSDHTESLTKAFLGSMPIDYHDAVTETFWNTASDSQKECIESVLEKVESSGYGQFCVLSGPSGSGKSFTGIYLANQLMVRHKMGAKYFSWTKLLSDISFEFSEIRNTHLRDLFTLPIIVLDNIGTDGGALTTHQARSILEIIEKRYSDRLSTVLVTSLPPTATRAKAPCMVNLLGKSAWDKVSTGTVVKLQATSHRKQDRASILKGTH